MTLPSFIPRKLHYTAAEVAPWLDKSARTIRRWMDDGLFGDIHHTPDGRRITYDGLLAYYAGHRNEPGKA